MPDRPEPDEPLLRETENNKAEGEGNQPVLWALLGLILIGLFVIALRSHWFGV